VSKGYQYWHSGISMSMSSSTPTPTFSFPATYKGAASMSAEPKELC